MIRDAAYRKRVAGGSSHGHRQHAQKLGKDRACVSGDILADRQTDTQTDRQTYSSQYFATAPASEENMFLATTGQYIPPICLTKVAANNVRAKTKMRGPCQNLVDCIPSYFMEIYPKRLSNLANRETRMTKTELSSWVQISCFVEVKPRLHDTTCCQTGCQTGLTTG